MHACENLFCIHSCYIAGPLEDVCFVFKTKAVVRSDPIETDGEIPDHCTKKLVMTGFLDVDT